MLSTLAPSPALAGFGDPFIDVDEWRDAPVRHRYLHGGFGDGETRFSLYVPPGDVYAGRFFQHVTPVPQSEHLAQSATGEEDRIAFSIESGAAFLETNGGGMTFVAGEAGDPTLGAYRANAACATVAKQLLVDLHGEHAVHGYAYGGSGGAYRTIGAAENTEGVWHGFVPYVPGSPMAVPNVFAVRLHAHRILADRFDQIDDALAPGGSGDPYAGLTDEEAQALREVTRLGFPPRSWFGHRTMGGHAFSVIFPPLMMVDPGYFTDFWTVPGYEGADPGSSVHAARVVHRCEAVETLTAAQAGRQRNTAGEGGVDESFKQTGGEAVAVRLSAPVPAPLALAELVVESGEATGARFVLADVGGDVAMLDAGNDTAAFARIAPGDRVVVDNSNVLATQTYMRHQVPDGDQYPVWDQYRDASGEPRHPQRPMLVGPVFAAGAVGSLPNGAFGGHMIMVSSLLDREAYPWQADWYRQRVVEHLGDAEPDRFRLWYVDHALHGDSEEQEHPTRTVSYLGALHHALRALAAWVEEGVEPAPTTSYRIDDGQVVVPERAADDRGGIQPVVTLTANGGARVDVRPGATVDLVLEAEVPPGAGCIVGVDWDLDGSGELTEHEDVAPASSVTLRRTVVAPGSGMVFVTARVTAQCEGDGSRRFARLANLARVRVVATH